MINIGPELGAKFIKQLQEDARFLKKLRIMDYSLLIGIHRIESPDALGNVNADDSRHRRKQSNYGLKTWHQVVSSPLVAFDDAAEDGQGDRSPDSLSVDRESTANDGPDVGSIGLHPAWGVLHRSPHSSRYSARTTAVSDRSIMGNRETSCSSSASLTFSRDTTSGNVPSTPGKR